MSRVNPRWDMYRLSDAALEALVFDGAYIYRSLHTR